MLGISLINNLFTFKMLRHVSMLSVLGFMFCVTTVFAASVPEIVSKNGRHALMVDGAPFLMLGIQANNSSNYSMALKHVWPSFKKMHANTLEIPVAWEQIEPVEGEFDFSYVDILLREARENNARLVLLWFGTWKNNAPHYAPAWVKLNNTRFPRVVTKTGDTLNSLSPLGEETLHADKKAFLALISHLKKVDGKNTVIMVQVENEAGTWGADRDYSEMANEQFNAAVPADLVKKIGVKSGSWTEVFGKDADEFFHAYHIARFCEELASAGKAIKPLPMYTNVALRDPFNPTFWEKGGATDNVIHIWKATAPHLDAIAPDIYNPDHKTVMKWLEQYSGKTNPLLVPEIGNSQPYARYFFDTLGKGAIGFAPFGMDDTDYVNYPLGADKYDDETIENFAQHYRVIAPMMREWAKLSFENNVWGVSEPLDADVVKMAAKPDATKEEKEIASKKIAESLTQTLDVGRWNAEITYGRPMFFTSPPVGNDIASGGALIAQLSENEYLVTAYKARVEFKPSEEIKDSKYMIERVEEGHYENGRWIMERVWNGDQTDWGLNFAKRSHVLKVKMATYKIR